MERFVTIDTLTDENVRRVLVALDAAGLKTEAAFIRACLPCPECGKPITRDQASIMPASTDTAGQRWHMECHPDTRITS